MGQEYQGEVYLSVAMQKVLPDFPELAKIIEEFKVHWRTGHHPNFGKDAILHDPAAIRKSAVRHVHLIPNPLTPTDAKHWLKGFFRADHARRPSSDSWLAYCVTDKRDCCVLAYLKDNAHTQARQGVIIGRLIDSAEDFFKAMEAFPLPEGDHSDIFEDDWLATPEG